VAEEPVQVVEEPIAVIETPNEVIVVEEVLAQAPAPAEKQAKPRSAKPAAKKAVVKKTGSESEAQSRSEETCRETKPGQKVEEITRSERDRETSVSFFKMEDERMNDAMRERERARGHIELICGSMFSGKTEELIRRR